METVGFRFKGEAFTSASPFFVQERIPDREPASHPRLHGPFHYARANVQILGWKMLRIITEVMAVLSLSMTLGLVIQISTAYGP
jgi:hypothetical protein